MISNKYYGRIGLLAAFSTSVAVLLSGCGGATTNPSQSATAQIDPLVYGLNFATGLTGSNFSFSDGTNTYGAITGAISSTAVGFFNEGGSIDAGFAPGGQNVVPISTASAAGQTGTPPFLSFGSALAPSQGNVVFRALVANGNNGTSVDPINPSSVVMTSSEVPAFTEQLSFDNAGIGTGPAGNGQYTTPAFTLPFTTTGLHTFNIAVASQSGKSSSTTFQTVVVAPTASAVVVQVVAPRNPNVAVSSSNPLDPIAGASVTISNALTGVAAYNSVATAPQTSVTDFNGVAIVFSTPGSQTITATAIPATATDLDTGNPVTAAVTGTDTEVLVAGQALTALPNTSSATGDTLSSAYTIEAGTLATAAALRGHAHVSGRFIQRALRH